VCGGIQQAELAVAERRAFGEMHVQHAGEILVVRGQVEGRGLGLHQHLALVEADRRQHHALVVAAQAGEELAVHLEGRLAVGHRLLGARKAHDDLAHLVRGHDCASPQ